MVQMIAQVSIGKSSNIFANYELADKFQDFTLGGKLSNISLSVCSCRGPCGFRCTG